jgi:cellulose synthase/poly-beta-1,6-N-acetylglucosamine synthase-like glycosyltransferase
VAESVFWVSLLAVGYTYLGYPLLLWAWSKAGSRRVLKSPSGRRVSVVIAVYNEERHIAGRLDNCLSLDYPADQLDVIVVSDGSTDRTCEIAGRFSRERVTLIALPERVGKAVAINRGLAVAQGEIIVFADARQRFAPSAVSELVANFADPTVGAVSGELVLESDPDRPGADGIGLYWRVEKWIRRTEGAIDSVIGATGAIYAVRRELFEPLPDGTILDDLLIPMRIAMKGRRVVFENRALAFDRVTQDYRVEFRRKVRTLAGNYQAISLCPDLMKPWRNRLFLQFVSHKACRLAAPFGLVALLASNLVFTGGWRGCLLAFQATGYSLALAGWGLSRVGVRARWTSAAFSFCLLNYAALVGAVRFAMRDTTLWNKRS